MNEPVKVPKWSPSSVDRVTISFARLLRIATAPESETSGRRKRFLERQLFKGSEDAKAAYRERFYQAAKAALVAAQARDTGAFVAARQGLAELWEGTAPLKRIAFSTNRN